MAGVLPSWAVNSPRYLRGTDGPYGPGQASGCPRTGSLTRAATGARARGSMQKPMLTVGRGSAIS
jgi:hypothetical protein